MSIDFSVLSVWVLNVITYILAEFAVPPGAAGIESQINTEAYINYNYRLILILIIIFGLWPRIITN